MSEEYKQRGILQNIFNVIIKTLLFLWLILFLSICFISIVLITRPSFLWGNFVSVVNGDKFIIHEPINTSVAQEAVNSQFENEGQIIISEEIMTSLTRPYLSTYLPNSTIDIKENKIMIYWTILADNEKNDLIGSIEISSEDKTFELTDFAIGRFSAPSFIRTFIEDRILAVTGIKQPIDINIVLQSMNLDPERFDIKTLKLENDNLIIDLEINNSIFNTND